MEVTHSPLARKGVDIWWKPLEGRSQYGVCDAYVVTWIFPSSLIAQNKFPGHFNFSSPNRYLNHDHGGRHLKAEPWKVTLRQVSPCSFLCGPHLLWESLRCQFLRLHEVTYLKRLTPPLPTKYIPRRFQKEELQMIPFIHEEKVLIPNMFNGPCRDLTFCSFSLWPRRLRSSCAHIFHVAVFSKCPPYSDVALWNLVYHLIPTIKHSLPRFSPSPTQTDKGKAMIRKSFRKKCAFSQKTKPRQGCPLLMLLWPPTKMFNSTTSVAPTC